MSDSNMTKKTQLHEIICGHTIYAKIMNHGEIQK